MLNRKMNSLSRMTQCYHSERRPLGPKSRNLFKQPSILRIGIVGAATRAVEIDPSTALGVTGGTRGVKRPALEAKTVSLSNDV